MPIILFLYTVFSIYETLNEIFIWFLVMGVAAFFSV